MSIQTIERTSKRWKLYQALGGMAVVVGLLMGFGGDGDVVPVLGLVLGFLGLVAIVIGRAGAWWENG